MRSRKPLQPKPFRLARRLHLALGLSALMVVSLPSHAIIRCPNPATVTMASEIRGTPITAASKAGDVILTRVYRVNQPYTVTAPINNDRMRLGAGWVSNPSGPFTTISAAQGLGIRWRHFDSGTLETGTLIYAGSNHANTFAMDQPQTVAGTYTLTRLFTQEFVLTDPKLYTGAGNFYMSSPFNLFAHGTGTGTSQNVSNGCNDSGSGGPVTSPKLIYIFWQDHLSTVAPPPPLKPTCSVSTPSRNLSVSMQALDFPKAANTASTGSVPLAIELENCGVNAKPSINFTDSLSPGNTSNLLTLKGGAGSNVASLGGILLRHNGKDVAYGPEVSNIVARSVAVGTATSGTPKLKLDLNAHLQRKAPGEISAGPFEAAATFILSYP